MAAIGSKELDSGSDFKGDRFLSNVEKTACASSSFSSNASTACARGTDLATNKYLVTFESIDDNKSDPLQWSKQYKWGMVALISIMTLIVNLATLTPAPAAPLILVDFHSTSSIDETLLISIWEFGEAFAPLLIAPLSEIYGRAPVYNTANFLFCIFSMACALSSNLQMLIAFRFINGMCVASIVLNPSIVGDMFKQEERGGAMSIMGLLPLLGPVLGPVAGSYLSQAIGWRWLFWLATILSGVLAIAFFFVFQETYKVVILEKQAARIRKETGNPAYKSEYDRGETSTARFLIKAMVRPVRMLFASPIIFILSIYVALIFAYTYVLLTTMTEVFERIYHFSTGASGLAFLGLGVGLTAGTLLCKIMLDKYIVHMKKTLKDGMQPEHRLPPMILGGLVIPVALFWYGWAVQAHVHWMAPIVATGVLGFGVIMTIISTFSYIVDAFGIHAASALAANISLRCITGAFLPLAAPPMYRRLGLGWGNSVLGFISLAFVPVPLLLMKFGRRIREKTAHRLES